MSIEWIDYKNKKILYIKYGGLTQDEMCDQVKLASKAIVDTKSEDNLIITDMTDCFVNEDFIELAKEQGKLSLPYCQKTTIVGISGIKKIILKGVNAISSKARVPFDTVEEAKEWLVQ